MLIKVPAADLKVGMFVAELDRPWLDTPFIFQGFLLEDEEQLAELRRYCASVAVDRTRSAAGLFPALRDWERDVDRLVLTRSGDFRVAADGEEAPVQRGFLDRLKDLFAANPGAEPAGRDTTSAPDFVDDETPSTPVRYEFIPDAVELTYHRPTKTLEEEIGPAREAFGKSEEFTRQVFEDLQHGGTISIERIEEVMHSMVESMVRNPEALLWVAHLRHEDTETYAHDLQVAVYLVAFGRHLCLPTSSLDQLCMLGLLLDIGKTRLPRELLAKPGRLTPVEFALTKRHVQFGLDLLKSTPTLDPDILQGLAQHHEREDGSGYPQGLAAGSISLFGRMSAIVDSFVAITNVRPYAQALSALDTLRKLTLWSGGLFHKPLVEQFIQSIGVFPVGSLVELSTGEVAVVIRQSKVRRLQPRVLVICGPDKVPTRAYRVMELLYQADRDSQRVHIVRGLPAGAYGLDPQEYYLS